MNLQIHYSSQIVATLGWPLFVDAAIKSALALLLAWAVTLIMRRASAASRHLVWMLAVTGVLALPVLCALLPGWKILPGWMNHQPQAVPPISRPASPPFVVHAPPGNFLSRPDAPPRTASNAASLPGTVVLRALPPAHSTAQTLPTTTITGWQRLSWRLWAMLAWACGAGVMLSPVVVSLVGLWRLGRRSVPISGGSWRRLLDESTERLNLHRSVQLLQGGSQKMPMTWGFVRPKLLLPPEADGWPIHRRSAVLMHELAHVKRTDFLTQLLVHVVRAAYWFNPLIWLASRQIAIESEAACDDLVLMHEAKGSDYAEHLLAVVTSLNTRTSLPIASIAMARSSRLENRLRAILDANRNRRSLTVFRIGVAIALLAASVMPLAMIGAAESVLPAQAEPFKRSGIITDRIEIAQANQGGPLNAIGRLAGTRAGPGELAGTITDDAGNSLSGVLVDVWSWCPGDDTKTDAMGHFILKKLGLEPVEIRISKEGFCPWYNSVQPTGVDLQIKLSDKTYFEGVVKGPDGAPLKNALVRADSGPKHNPSVEITSVWTETKTDQNGRYRLYVAPDKYVFEVHVPKVGAARLPVTPIANGETRTLDINLTAGISFHAIAVDSQTGAPIPNVLLSNWDHKGIEGKSDQEGKLTIDGLAAGKFEFQVEAKGYTRWWSPQAVNLWQKKELGNSLQRNFDSLEFDITAGAEPARIELERDVRITGIVQDPDGRPVAGATVAPALTGSGNSLTGDTRFSVVSAKDGSFVMTLPASGDVKYNLEAHDGKYQQWRKWANGVLDPIQTKPGDELNNVVIKLTRPAVVQGHVKDANGKPIADREVRATAADKRENRYYDPTTQTDKNGDFKLRFVRPGEHLIQSAPFWLTAEEAPKTSTVQLTLKEGEIKSDIELEGAASTRFPTPDEQIRKMIEKANPPTTQPKSQGTGANDAKTAAAAL